jgi:hypothetical protein
VAAWKVAIIFPHITTKDEYTERGQ